MLNLSEAIEEARGLKKRGVVFIQGGRPTLKILLACGELWECGRDIELRRFMPNQQQATKRCWKATNDL